MGFQFWNQHCLATEFGACHVPPKWGTLMFPLYELPKELMSLKGMSGHEPGL